MSSLASRVAARFITAYGIAMGQTVERGSARIHRFKTHFQITDLTFAGKRGKKVRYMNVRPSTGSDVRLDEWMDRNGKVLDDVTSYDAAKRIYADLLVDFPGEILVEEFQARGVDINPGGVEVIQMETPQGLRIKADPLGFTVWSSHKFDGPPGKPGFTQDTSYWPANPKKDAPRFYNWLKANRSDAQRMSIGDFRDLWRELDIPYDSH